ncbi:MAG: murein hydrolase activator EnvC family protein [Marmoricola sp.]
MPVILPLALLLLAPLGPAAPTPRPLGTWPLGPAHPVVRGFDPPAAPWAAGHRGVDLLGAPGEEVRAAEPGTVTFAGTLAGRGVVVVDHGDRRTTYEPVAAAVVVGQQVGAGAVIGHLQLPMSHCFPRACLHWGLIEGETYLDPLTLVGAGRVRLLPLDGAPASIPYATARSALSVRPFLPARRSGAPLAARVPLAPLAFVLRPAGGPAGTPLGAARW